jgi:hypothetical protein
VEPVPAGPNQDRALLSHQPRTQPPAFERQSGLAQQLAGIVSNQITQQPERGPLRAAIDIADRLHAPGAPPSLEVQHGDAVPEKDCRDGYSQRLDPDEQRGGAARR